MDIGKIQIGKWYNFEKLDKNGKVVIRSGIIREKWSTMVQIENMSGIYTCFNDQVNGECF